MGLKILGLSIIKGVYDRPLHDGYGIFPKIQIKEVTSHYRNGKVFLVVRPCEGNFAALGKKDKHYINFDTIEPLIISDVIVKAKMPKKLKANSELSDVQN